MLNAHDYQHVINPFQHQREHFEKHCNDKAWGLLWEQGTAKTKPTIDTGVYLYLNNKIDAIIVVAPPGVERNWKSDELPEHLPPDVALNTRVEVFLTKQMHRRYHEKKMDDLIKHDGLAILLFSYDAFMTQIGRNTAWKMFRHRRVLYILDESHNIKNPDGQRTKSLIKSSAWSEYKRILTGTPIAVGPFDLYSQILFLDNSFWLRKGIRSFWEYKDFFGVWARRKDVIAATNGAHDPGYDRLIEYQNLDILAEWLKEISDRHLKDDVLDLPPKLYSKRYVSLSAVQQEVYEQLKSEMMYQFEDGAVATAELPIVRLLRLQQVLCGYVPVDTEEPVRFLGNKNPRLEAIEEIRDETFHKTIIWARFRKDIDQIMDILGDKAVRYDGAVDDDEAERNKFAFQNGDAQWFVGTAQKGGPGLTLHKAKTVVYYSNSFKLIDRLQSEDRAHRAGMDEHPVNYIDIVCPDTVDERIIDNLRNKVDVASQITGDKLRDWI